MLAYTPTYPEQPPVPAAVAPAPRPFDTQAQIGYIVRGTRVSLDNSRVEGVVDNVLAASGQFRGGGWLFGFGAWRQKAPVTATVLAAIANPALNPEISEIRARAGHVFGLGPGWMFMGIPVVAEIGPSLAIVSQQMDPGGTGLPLTATPLDFAQTRRGLGLELPAVFGLGDGLEATLRLAAYPYAGGRLNKAPYAFHEHVLHLVEGGAGVRLKLMGGLDAEISADVSNWLGDVTLGGGLKEFRDLATSLAVGVVYRPERVGR